MSTLWYAAAQVRKGELAILSQASRWVVQLLGRLEEGEDDDGEDDSGEEGDSGLEHEEYADAELQAGIDRGAKRARTGF